MLRILSLGAGVQSSTLALLAARGEIGPMPDCAIFADTQSEPKAVMVWLDWLEAQLPFPVYRVTAGSLRDNLLTDAAGRFVSVPFFTDAGGDAGMTRRQCTREYKITPIQNKVRELLGLKKGERAPKHVAVEQWVGISWDERQRMKDSGKVYIKHRWPLIERAWTRGHCLEWWEREFPGRKPPKSACEFCPYTDDDRWIDMRDNDPEAFSGAILVDRSVRRPGARIARGLDAKLYAHRSLKPLDEVEFVPGDGGSMFGMVNECEGMCGV